MSVPIRINLVIAVYGPCPKLARTLESLAALKIPAGFDRLWIVENGDKGPAESILDSFKDHLPIEYRYTPVQGKSRALQATIDQIGDGLIVFTDDDVRVAPDWLAEYAQAAAVHGENAYYGGPLEAEYETPPPDWLRPHLPPSAVGWSLDDHDAPITQACFLGANYGVFAAALKAVGGYNFTLGVGAQGNPIGEEFDIQERLLATGTKAVYLPDARVWHWVPRERCTPAWALRRAHRIWLTNGLEDVKHLAAPREKGGPPRWLWRRVATLGLRSLAGRFSPSPQTRFDTRMPYYQWKGYLQGLRLAARTGRQHADTDEQPQGNEALTRSENP